MCTQAVLLVYYCMDNLQVLCRPLPAASERCSAAREIHALHRLDIQHYLRYTASKFSLVHELTLHAKALKLYKAIFPLAPVFTQGHRQNDPLKVAGLGVFVANLG